MIVIVLDASDGDVHIVKVESVDDLWDTYGFKESECAWMEIDDVTDILRSVISFMQEEEIGV